MSVPELTFLAIAVNIPLGWLRSRVHRFSWQWFLWIHLSIPLIIICRVSSHISWRWIPLLIASTVTGQLIGGRIRSRLIRETPSEKTEGVKESRIIK